MNKIKPQYRRRARRLALQAIYQWQLAQTPPAEIEQHLLQDKSVGKIDFEYFHELLHGIPQEITGIDGYIQPVLDRKISELNPVELAVLRIATYELIHRMDVPYRVVINEALELAKTFGASEGFKYVNGVLDKVAKKIRAQEIFNK